MDENLNMNKFKIVNLKDPSSNNDAATKYYVDNAIICYGDHFLKADGTNTMTANFNVGNNKIINLATPAGHADATTKNYVENKVYRNSVGLVP